MDMTTVLRMCLAALVCGTLTGCGGSSSDGGDCVSRYEPVARAPTSAAVKKAMLRYDERGPVASLRTQARGHDVGAGDRDAVRVVDLLDRRGRRLAQVDVWRGKSGAWHAGIWAQCID